MSRPPEAYTGQALLGPLGLVDDALLFPLLLALGGAIFRASVTGAPGPTLPASWRGGARGGRGDTLHSWLYSAARTCAGYLWFAKSLAVQLVRGACVAWEWLRDHHLEVSEVFAGIIAELFAAADD